ncbi:MAG TPA: ABC transporter ATP-binding protein [Methylomirabilota bacterium]|nr:ABC transporter ATP-binding protein [Methylomirabilota bacterium]
MDKPHVELDRVSKRFGPVSAVAEVCLALPEGEFTTLLGPSGCGKTTLLRLVAGFFRPDGGEIRIRGVRVNEVPPQRRSTVVVFQDYALFPHLTVFENVAYGLRRRGVPGDELRRRVREMLGFLGLDAYAAASPLALSGGQQQRVALARALVVEPDVLLLDEPLSNLDAKLRTRVRTELKEIQQALGKTTLLVTHDQEEALSVSDRVAVMEAGRIRQVGTPLEVYARPADRFVADFVGVANFVAATVRAVTADGVVLESPLGTLTAPGGRSFDPGQQVTVLLRPSALRLWAAPGPGRLPARIRSTSFLGALRRHQVKVGELRLVVDQPLGEGEAPPPESWLAIDPGHLHLLPAEA